MQLQPYFQHQNNLPIMDIAKSSELGQFWARKWAKIIFENWNEWDFVLPSIKLYRWWERSPPRLWYRKHRTTTNLYADVCCSQWVYLLRTAYQSSLFSYASFHSLLCHSFVRIWDNGGMPLFEWNLVWVCCFDYDWCDVWGRMRDCARVSVYFSERLIDQFTMHMGDKLAGAFTFVELKL